jgi:hypothetical protein
MRLMLLSSHYLLYRASVFASVSSCCYLAPSLSFLAPTLPAPVLLFSSFVAVTLPGLRSSSSSSLSSCSLAPLLLLLFSRRGHGRCSSPLPHNVLCSSLYCALYTFKMGKCTDISPPTQLCAYAQTHRHRHTAPAPAPAPATATATATATHTEPTARWVIPC